MGWASYHIEKLRRGETVSFRPRGHSMSGKIESGQLCTVAPTKVADVETGDVVLCTVNGLQYLHLVKAKKNSHVLIGNNRGGTNGWIGPGGVHGKLVRVED